MTKPGNEVASTRSHEGYYETYWSEDGFNPGRELPPQVAARLAGLVKNETACLDVGCGDGRTEGLWLNARAFRYVGVDVSRTAVDTARSLGLDARVIEDASELPFADDSFDVIVCFEVLEHLNASLQAVEEMMRVLKSGGSVVVTVPNVAYWQRRAEHCFGIWNPYGDDKSISEPWRDPHIRFFAPTSLRDMLERAGLADIRISGHEGAAYSSSVPGLRRIRGLSRVQPMYDRCQTRWPALFAARLHAVAVKPR